MFEKELRYYKTHKDELLKSHPNKFLVIKGDRLLGPYNTDKDAYEAGLQEFGNVPFLIKKVTKEEEIIRFPALVLGVVNADF
jgi:hypothetical protein